MSRRVLGGTDAAAILGLSPWRTPYQVWLEKTGRLEPQPPNNDMRRGTDLEPLVAKMYAERTGARLRQAKKLRHHKYPQLGGHPDRWAQINGGRRLVELKTTLWFDRHWGPDGSDQVPAHYAAQCIHYAAVSGTREIDLAALSIHDWELRIYHLAVDEAIADDFIRKLIDWWNTYVEADVPPPLLDSEPPEHRWPEARQGKTISADEDIRAKVCELRALRARIRELDLLAEDLAHAIQKYMGDAEVLLDGNRPIATWRNGIYRRCDLDRLRQEAPEVYMQFLYAAPVRRFRLVEHGGDDE